MTQYGEDNPNEDFFEGMKFMAIKILENESERLNIEIDSDYSFEEGCDGECGNFRNCEGGCMKSYCDHCDHLGCNCDCDSRKCACGPEDSDDSYEYDSDDCECFNKECACEKCKCADIRLKSGYNYKKYRVWKSKTPGQR